MSCNSWKKFKTYPGFKFIIDYFNMYKYFLYKLHDASSFSNVKQFPQIHFPEKVKKN